MCIWISSLQHCFRQIQSKQAAVSVWCFSLEQIKWIYVRNCPVVLLLSTFRDLQKGFEVRSNSLCVIFSHVESKQVVCTVSLVYLSVLSSVREAAATCTCCCSKGSSVQKLHIKDSVCHFWQEAHECMSFWSFCSRRKDVSSLVSAKSFQKPSVVLRSSLHIGLWHLKIKSEDIYFLPAGWPHINTAH